MVDIFSFEKLITIAQNYAPNFIQGMMYTILLALFSIMVGFVFALVITSLRMSKFKIIRFIGTAYVEIFRGTPMLVQIMIIYYGLATLLPIPSFMMFGFIDSKMFIPGVISVALNSAAYIAEIIRAGILAVDGGQTEASRSLGMTQTQCMRYIIFPQAVKNILPALANEFVVVIKESSICMVIGIPEMMYNANNAVASTFRPIEPLVIAAVLYFCLTFPTSKLIAYVERRMRRGDKR